MAAKKKQTVKEKPQKAAKTPAAPEVLTRVEVPEDSLGSDAEKRKKLREFAASMNKDRRVVAMADEAPNVYELRRPTGVIQLDTDIGGGFPAGGMSIISGPDNCVHGDTELRFLMRDEDAEKDSPLELREKRKISTLYKRWHGLRRGANTNVSFWLFSIDDQGKMVRNKVMNVIKTGTKECFLLKTRGGREIKATADHRFFNGTTYLKLKELKIGSAVLTYKAAGKNVYPTADVVSSIEPVGMHETYDLRMADPLHNYVANEFVVHNSGKTWLILRAMAMHQRLYGPKSCLAFASAEGAFDYKRALNSGLIIPIPDEMISEWNQERLQLGMPAYTKEEVLWFKRKVGEFTLLRGHTGEELMNVVLEAVKANIFGIIGVDSFSILLPEADEDKDVGGTPRRAGNANLMTDFIKKYTPYTSGLHERNETSLIGVMQVRANAAKADAGHLAKYLKDWAVTGAYATRHGKLVDVTVWDGSPLKKTVQGQQVIYGKPFYWKIEKGKAGCHDNVQGETEFRYDIPHGHDDIWALIVNGTRRGVFVEEGKKIQVYHPVTKQKTEFGGFASFPAFGRAIAEDFEFELQMRLYVLAAAGVQCLYRPLA